MNVLLRSKDPKIVRWQQRGLDRLRQASQHLQQLLAVDRPTRAQALIPTRAAQPHTTRQPLQRTWRD